MKLLLFFALMMPTFSFASPTGEACTEEFFGQFREKAVLHLCQISLAPNCQPPQVGWDKQNRFLITSLAMAAGTATAEALQKDLALASLRTAALAKALDSGAFFSAKLYGHDIYESVRNKKIPLTKPQLVGRGSVAFLTFLSVYFYEDKNPGRCNDMMSSQMMTMNMDDGICKSSLQMSENVVKFMSKPLKDQVKAASDFPVVCEYYKKLDQHLEKELDPKTRLIDFTCENGKPKSFTAALGEPEQKFMITPVKQGTGHLIGMKATSINGPVEEINVRFKNASEIQRPKSDPKRTYEVMKAWWSASSVVSGCCDGSVKGSVCAGGVNAGSGASGEESSTGGGAKIQR